MLAVRQELPSREKLNMNFMEYDKLVKSTQCGYLQIGVYPLKTLCRVLLQLQNDKKLEKKIYGIFVISPQSDSEDTRWDTPSALLEDDLKEKEPEVILTWETHWNGLFCVWIDKSSTIYMLGQLYGYMKMRF